MNHPIFSNVKMSPLRSSHGFTLLELLVVLVILSLLALVVTPQVFKYLDGARINTAKVQLQGLQTALDLYRLDTGAYPAAEGGLKNLISKPAGIDGWNGPYVAKAASLKDPWGREYQYANPGKHGEIDLWSQGPSPDDPAQVIGNW